MAPVRRRRPDGTTETDQRAERVLDDPRRVDEAKRKPRRGRLGATAKLAVDNLDPSYKYHWVNDEGDRVVQAQQVGYDIVHDPRIASEQVQEATPSGLGSGMSKLVGTDGHGHALRAVLMRKPRDDYEADQAEAQAEVDAVDREISEGAALRDPTNRLRAADQQHMVVDVADVRKG